MPADIVFRQLTPDDAPAFRSLRLAGLKAHAEAFGEDYDEACRAPESDWRDRLAGRVHVGILADGTLVATANYDRLPGRKLAHRANVYGVHVDPLWQGHGLGLRLLDGLAGHAGQAGVLQLHLGVGKDNLAAQRLYQKAGYRFTGEDPRALIVDGRPIDELLMVRFLDGYDG